MVLSKAYGSSLRRIGFLALALGSLAGCSDDSGGGNVMCTREARPALAVVVVDSVTGAGLAAEAKAVARDGGFVDTLRGVDSLVSGVHERPGTYRVEVTIPGYRDWIREGVRVESDECHVQTVRLRALLAPQE